MDIYFGTINIILFLLLFVNVFYVLLLYLFVVYLLHLFLLLLLAIWGTVLVLHFILFMQHKNRPHIAPMFPRKMIY